MPTLTLSSKHLWIQSALASLVATLLSLFGYATNHAGLDEGVFLLVPLCTGLAIAFMSKGRSVIAITGLTSLLLSLSILFFTGLEGFGCVLMALPILFVSTGFGALIGYLIGKKFIKDYGNITVVAFCLGLMALVGWANPHPSDPESLSVQSRIEIRAPMDRVWEYTTETGKLSGDSRVLKLLGLPVPINCILDSDGMRVCYFDQGQIIQTVSNAEFGQILEVEILEALRVRPWLEFNKASYQFHQHNDFVEVIRTDFITSTLQPRWYWSWFESQCVKLEQRYVLESIRTKAGTVDQS